MSEHNFIEFADEEIQPITFVEEIEEPALEGAGTLRGISSEEILEWITSLNAYENPKTGQKFSVQITTDTDEEQTLLREHLRVGARVVSAIADTSAEDEERKRSGEFTTDRPSTEQDDDVEILTGEESTDGSTVQIRFEVLDAADVEPPYEVQFYFAPSAVAQNEIGSDDNDEIPPAPEEGQMRSGLPIIAQSKLTSFMTIFTGKRVALRVQGRAIPTDSWIQTRLFGSRDSSPPKGNNGEIRFYTVRKSARKDLRVVSNLTEDYTFEVQLIGSGTYVYRGQLWT